MSIKVLLLFLLYFSFYSQICFSQDNHYFIKEDLVKRIVKEEMTKETEDINDRISTQEIEFNKKLNRHKFSEEDFTNIFSITIDLFSKKVKIHCGDFWKKERSF